MSRRPYIFGSLSALIAAAVLSCAPAHADPLFALPTLPEFLGGPPPAEPQQVEPRQVQPQQAQPQQQAAPARQELLFALLTPALPQFLVGPHPAAPRQIEPQQAEPLQSAPDQRDQYIDEGVQLAPRLQRQIVDNSRNEPAGTIIVDTPHTYLYYVLGGGKAIRYGIGVGREGFTWSGTKAIDRKAEWPDWYPPAEMVARQPYLPRVTLGGPGNPLGARALYIGGTQYRIHGTNDPTTIGKNVSSGCIRLTNEDIKDLYSRAQVGAKVVVLPQGAEAARESKNEPKAERKAETKAERKAGAKSLAQHASARGAGWQAKARAAIAASRPQATANRSY